MATAPRFVALSVLAAVLAACSGAGAEPEPRAKAGGQDRASQIGLRCLDAGRRGGRVYSLCTTHARNEPGTFYVREGDSVTDLPVRWPTRAAARYRVGRWSWAALSPDGKTLLAQWSAECEVPIAYFIDLRLGQARPVTPERRHGGSPSSIGLGWTPSGDAVVAFPRGPCGTNTGRPGIYRVSPRGAGMRYVRPYRDRPGARPRTIDEPASS